MNLTLHLESQLWWWWRWCFLEESELVAFGKFSYFRLEYYLSWFLCDDEIVEAWVHMLYTICLSMQLYKLWIVIYLYLLILVLGFIHLPSQRTTLTSCFPHSLKTCKRIEWNDDGDSGGGGGGWRNGAMGRQHITLEAHRSRISLLPCTFAAPRVALCATVRSFTDLANYEALTQIFLMTFLQQFFFHNRVILFNWELVVLHSSPRMFGEFSVHAWKCGVSEWRTYYIASLRVKLIILAYQKVLN